MANDNAEFWSNRIEAALRAYWVDVVRSVAQRLLRHRSQWPTNELIERIRDASANAATIDRRLRELSPACRKLLALIGLSRQPQWQVGHLLSMLALLGHSEGATPVLTLLEHGLLFPANANVKLRSFEQWLGTAGDGNLEVFAHPQVAQRAKAEELGLPELPATKPLRAETREADGLEWPLRLALVWQQVNEAALRRTMQQDFFKRDLQRLADDSMLNAPFAESPWPVPDSGPLAVLWAWKCGLLAESRGELTSASFPDAWMASLPIVVARLWLALSQLEAWDPENGWLPNRASANPFQSVYLPLLLLLARQPAERWLHPNDIADWLFMHHPYWRHRTIDNVAAWLHVVLYGLFLQLKILQSAPGESDAHLVRLSPLGRWLASGNGAVPAMPEFPQTILVQANFEVLAFRQGLTPALIADLSKFARWKSFGPACQLELISEQVYRGLEAGMTYDSICRLLERHGMRPLPENVAEALRTWANKRERIVIYSDATLLEFESSGELDAAVSRGLVEAKVTDRIGLVRDDESIDYRQLRLSGTRDFAAKPERCLTLFDDGVTFSVDGARSDLLLETELAQVAMPINGVDTRERTYRFTRESLHSALDRGTTIAGLDEWLTLRSGQPLSAAARLLAANDAAAEFHVDRCMVMKTPTPELADGLMQLKETRGLIRERLGPQALLVSEDDLPRLRDQIERLGQKMISG